VTTPRSMHSHVTSTVRMRASSSSAARPDVAATPADCTTTLVPRVAWNCRATTWSVPAKWTRISSNALQVTETVVRARKSRPTIAFRGVSVKTDIAWAKASVSLKFVICRNKNFNKIWDRTSFTITCRVWPFFHFFLDI
jgi:hypothetical protein